MLFQRFAQADASTTRRFGGTGLGLAISKAFAEMLGGTVSIASSPGKGSTFEVSVPVDANSAPQNAAIVKVSEGNGDLILVIDDDPSTQDLLSRFLTKEGFTVRVAEDGKSGLALAHALKPRHPARCHHAENGRLDGPAQLEERRNSRGHSRHHVYHHR